MARKSKINEAKREVNKKMTIKGIKKKAKISIKGAKKRYQ